MAPVDILVVSVDSTGGWTASARELTSALVRAGTRAELVETGPVRQVRTFALTDLQQARAARRAYARAAAAGPPAAVIYCSVTAALLWPRPGAIWLDAVAAENRPGRHGVWQRTVERRRLARAPLLMKMSQGALGPLEDRHPEAVVIHAPVEPSAPDGTLPPPARDIDVIAYAGNPQKKQLERMLDAWGRGRREGEQLVVTGVDDGRRIPGVRFAGRMAPAEHRALLRRSRVFLAAPRREDYGIAQLEALADGCVLVSAPAPGAYPALELARRLDPRLVAGDLVAPLRIAHDDPAPGYAERARELLAPFSRRAMDLTIAQHVLPVLLSPSERA
ncbi:MAG: hypothetical protein QOD66_3126 [Solirubrobacteraceae bacterium]|nr:hypothetical protein [Solirubrobacteraceae bacterium]